MKEIRTAFYGTSAGENAMMSLHDASRDRRRICMPLQVEYGAGRNSFLIPLPERQMNSFLRLTVSRTSPQISSHLTGLGGILVTVGDLEFVE